MSKLFNSDDDDLGYLDDSIHINWKKLLPAIIIVAAAAVSYTHLTLPTTSRV